MTTGYVGPGGQWVTVQDTPQGASRQRFTLYSRSGNFTSPAGQATWASAPILISMPGAPIIVPAGLLIVGASELRISVLWACGTNTGGVNCQMTVGTSNSFSDSQPNSAFVGSANEWDQVASFTFPTSTTMVGQSPNSPKNGTPAGQLGAEYSTNINTAANMYINFGTTNGSTNGNVFKVVRALVEVFQ